MLMRFGLKERACASRYPDLLDHLLPLSSLLSSLPTLDLFLLSVPLTHLLEILANLDSQIVTEAIWVD